MRIALRHELNGNLRRAGGHVGYYVRPSFRRLGAGSEMMRQLLTTPMAQAIGQLLVTCDESNGPSIKIIQKFGGQVFVPEFGDRQPGKLYFWIQVSK